jgi:hypothetical protein
MPSLALGLIMILVLGGESGALPEATAQEVSPSLQVARRKALFIEQFTRLVDWPESAWADDPSFVVCVLGRSETAEELRSLAAWRKFKGRPTEVSIVQSVDNLSGCRVLYIAASGADRLASALEAIADAPVLAVGDTPGFVERGVHLNLFEERRSKPKAGTYVGYELNVRAIHRSQLSFDPQLLSQARRVHSPAKVSEPVKRP